MCAIIKFPRHKLMNCRGTACEGCPACEWNAAICQTCGGAEGSLATECPQVRMTMQQSDDVHAGRLDFVRGQWVTKDRPKMTGR